MARIFGQDLRKICLTEKKDGFATPTAASIQSPPARWPIGYCGGLVIYEAA
jgi:hypothetical protein